MPHRTTTRRKCGIANRDGAMYAAWVEGKLPHHRLATDGITRDILYITGRMPLPFEAAPIMTAMSMQETGYMLRMKLYLFGYMCGVHRQRRKDRAVRQSRRQKRAEGFHEDYCATAASHPLKAYAANLRTLADRLDSAYHAAEAYEHNVHREGRIGTDGSWHGDEIALAVARERMTLLRSVLGDLEPILYRMQDEGAGQDGTLKERGADGQPDA